MKRELHHIHAISFGRRSGSLECTCGHPLSGEHEELREAFRAHRKDMGLKTESHAHRLGEYDDTPPCWMRRSRADWQRKKGAA